MENFDLRKYLAENRLLKEEIDVNKILSDGGYDIIDDEELLMTVKSRLKGKSNIDAEKLNLLVMKIEDEEGGNIDFTESKLLKEEIDPVKNEEIARYVKEMFKRSVYDYEGIQSDVWSKAEYAATSPGEGSVFMDLVDHLKSVGGKDVLEGNPDIELELLPNEDIQWKAEIILNPQDDLRYKEIDTFLNSNFDEVKTKIGNIPSKFKIMGDSKVATAGDGERGIDISFDKEHMLSLFPEEDPFNEVESIEIAGQTVYYNDYL